MCDTYVPDIGYICAYCKVEFTEELTKESEMENFSEKAIKDHLETFLSCKKTEYSDSISIGEFFKKYT